MENNIIPLEVIVRHGLDLADAISCAYPERSRRLYEQCRALYKRGGNPNKEIENRMGVVEAHIQKYSKTSP